MPGSIPEIGDKFLRLGTVAVVDMFVGRRAGRVPVIYGGFSLTKLLAEPIMGLSI